MNIDDAEYVSHRPHNRVDIYGVPPLFKSKIMKYNLLNIMMISLLLLATISTLFLNKTPALWALFGFFSFFISAISIMKDEDEINYYHPNVKIAIAGVQSHLRAFLYSFGGLSILWLAYFIATYESIPSNKIGL